MSSSKVKSLGGSAASSVQSQATSGRFFRPVPYSTTLAMQQFFEGGTMEEYALKRTTASSARASPSPHPSHRSSRSHKPSSTVHGKSSSSKNPSSSSRPSSSRAEPDPKRSRAKPHHSDVHIAPEVSLADRDVGHGASLPVVDENGLIWRDWEEKQEYTPLMADEEQASAWVGFPGSTGHETDSSDEDPITPIASTFTLRAELEAFSFQSTTTESAISVGPMEESPMRPRGVERRRVRADSLPTTPTTPLPKLHVLGQEEFLASSFDPFKAMGNGARSQMPLPLSISKRASFSLKGIKSRLWGKKLPLTATVA